MTIKISPRSGTPIKKEESKETAEKRLGEFQEKLLDLMEDYEIELVDLGEQWGNYDYFFRVFGRAEMFSIHDIE